MDACHVLLGRPWMFDRKVIHNGFLKTYSVYKGGKKITLKPLSPSELHKNKPTKKPEHSGCLLSFIKPFLKPLYHEFNAF